MLIRDRKHTKTFWGVESRLFLKLVFAVSSRRVLEAHWPRVIVFLETHDIEAQATPFVLVRLRGRRCSTSSAASRAKKKVVG